MKINLAKSAGFCFGVKRALQIATKAAALYGNICILGDIVHNEDVVKQIERLGIKKIRRLSKGGNRILLIRAHGSPAKTIREARGLGYKIIDATCPMVKEIHRICRKWEERGWQIIVIGDKKHDEVLGIIGQLKKKALVIDSLQCLPENKLQKIKQAAVVVQSTQNTDNVLKIVDVLKLHINKLEFFNTICQPTRIKQKETNTLPRENDVMVIIGSRRSANTKRLYQISTSLNKRTYWVQARTDLKRAWFKTAKSVGIISGASTPDSTTQAVLKQIRNYS